MDDDQELRWTPELGMFLRRERGAASKREAARRAGFSESTWRALELGVRRPARGIEVPVNPSVGTLIAAANAVGASRREVLALAGLDGYDTTDGDGRDGDGPSVSDRLTAVEDGLKTLEERVDSTDQKVDEVLRLLRGEG